MQQTIARPKPKQNGNSQVQTVIITAITLFALSGFMVGFAIGAFARPHTGAQPTGNNPKPSTAAKQQTPTPAATATPQPPSLDCPSVMLENGTPLNDGTFLANSNTQYTLSAVAKDKTNIDVKGPCGQIKTENTATGDGLTCRLWIIKTGDPTGDISKEQLQDIANLNNPFPHEIQNGLIFDPTTPQVQPCTKGTVSWKYQISPTVEDGKYNLMVLTDWQGLRWNWSWAYITVQKDKH